MLAFSHIVVCYGSFGVRNYFKRVSFQETVPNLAKCCFNRCLLLSSLKRSNIFTSDEVLMQPRKSVIRNLKTELQVSLQAHGSNEISCCLLSSFTFDPFLLIWPTYVPATYFLYGCLCVHHIDFDDVRIKAKLTLPFVRLLNFHPSTINEILLYGNRTCCLIYVSCTWIIHLGLEDNW